MNVLNRLVLSRIGKAFTKINHRNNGVVQISAINLSQRTIATTVPLRDLTEFFDDQKNWGANEVKTGRSWLKDELRLKSNSDLHKLWYVLIKERNMLLTMEEECKEKMQLFPSPERIDKVADSMDNLEEVIRERNRAYYMLESGETGERPTKAGINSFGLRYRGRLSEHTIPKFMNKFWRSRYGIRCHPQDVSEFLSKYREQLFLKKKREKTRNFNHVIGLMNRFPNIDMEAVKQEYPDVDIEKAKRSRRYKPPPVFNE